MKINHSVVYCVLALTCCVLQQGLVAAAAQEKQPSVTAAQTGSAVTTKPGVAGGAGTTLDSSPALTGVRRPLYRLCKSDVLTISFTFSPEFDQTVSVQPDGYIALGRKAAVRRRPNRSRAPGSHCPGLCRRAA